jgi:putative redox protein
METTVRWTKGVQFLVDARGHQAICDQPAQNGGEDTGMTPPEFMLASLATCAAYYVVQYLNFNHLSTEGLEVKVEADKAMNPPRLGTFRIIVGAPGVEGESHIEGMIKAAHKCLIHNTLMVPPSVSIQVLTGSKVG